MKKILVRAHMNPFDNLDAAQVLLLEDRTGANIGNMLFANSVIRTLMTEETQVDILHTGRDLTPEMIERINAEYDCVVMPFANAFRVSFRRQLRPLAKFVRQLKVPCVVPGIGISASLQKPLQEKNPFDGEVKAFIRAVLEKSAVIGTRGEETSAYLSRLGFKEGSEHRVIGCPSLFWNGEEFPQIVKKELTPSSAVGVNWKMELPEALNRFMKENIAHFPNATYIAQNIDEIRMMYYGMALPKGKYKKIPAGYPSSAVHEWFQNDKARSFINVPSWMDFLRRQDFVFGSRIHGNIAALLAGTPCFVIVSDYRILELVRYHGIPHIDYRKLKKDDDIFRFYEKADYTGLAKRHRECFAVYKKFLEENGLEHIFTGSGQRTCPYDRKMQEINAQPALTPFFAEPFEEQERRREELETACRTLEGAYSNLQVLEPLLDLYGSVNKIGQFLRKIRRR